MKNVLTLILMIVLMNFISNAHAEKNVNLEIQIKSTTFKSLLGQ